MKEPRPLLALYKLLWEQIKDEDITSWFSSIIIQMHKSEIINFNEYEAIRNSIVWRCGDSWPLTKQGTEARKAFVQRMIKELENDK